MIDPRLRGRVVLITGANHGIGAATAAAFAQQGADVFIHYFRLPTDHTDQQMDEAERAGVGGMLLYHAKQRHSAEAVVQTVREAGVRAEAWEADLADAACVHELFDRAIKTFDRVDVLVNNHTHDVNETFDPARVSEAAGVVALSAEQIDRHHAVNVRATVLLMQCYTEHYLARHGTDGRIINLSTAAAPMHHANVSYAATKHAIESYSRSAAAELGRYGITVNVVSPGPTQTGYIPPEAEEGLIEATPLRRLGEPQDITGAIIFLASAQGHWITGQVLQVGGGWRMY